MELYGRCDSCASQDFRKDPLSIGADPPYLAYIPFVPEGLTLQQTIGVFQRLGRWKSVLARHDVDDNLELPLAVPI